MNSKYNWEYQKEANLASFCEERDYLERKNVLKKLTNSFEKAKVRWAIVCSLNLYMRGVVDDFNDIDLLVEAKDAEIIKDIMLNELQAVPIEVPDIGFCRSDVIMYFDIGKVRLLLRKETLDSTLRHAYDTDDCDIAFDEGVRGLRRGMRYENDIGGTDIVLPEAVLKRFYDTGSDASGIVVRCLD